MTEEEIEQFHIFFDENYPKVLAFMLGWACRRELAEEAVQEAFVAAARYQGQGNTIDFPVAWLCTAARRAYGKLLKWWHRTQELTIDPPAEWSPDDWRAQCLDVRWAIKQLPKRQREVVFHHYWEGKPVAAIGEELGITTGAVTSHLTEARKKLRKIFGIPSRAPAAVRSDGLAGAPVDTRLDDRLSVALEALTAACQADRDGAEEAYRKIITRVIAEEAQDER